MSNTIEKTDKKISRVIKWLERCAVACRGGSCESALMDIECARVEFDGARDEIWGANGKKYAQAKVNYRPGAIAFTVGLILLFAAAPISVVNKVHEEAGANLIEWVTPDEKLLLANLRSRFADSNIEELRNAEPKASANINISANQTNHRRPAPAQRAIPPRHEAVKTRVAETKKDDLQVFYLIKAGERALRNDKIVVKVE